MDTQEKCESRMPFVTEALDTQSKELGVLEDNIQELSAMLTPILRADLEEVGVDKKGKTKSTVPLVQTIEEITDRIIAIRAKVIKLLTTCEI